MRFNSLSFLVFLPCVVVFYWATPRKYRWLLALVASYGFYAAADPTYVILLLLVTTVSYVAGGGIKAAPTRRRRRAWLVFGVATSLGAMVVFKVWTPILSLLAENTTWVSSDAVANSWLLPIGLSFFALQTTTYVIDSFRGCQDPDRHFGRFALYLSFFPQLLNGPIERSRRLMPQLRSMEKPSLDAVRTGTARVLLGLVKKVVIADSIAMVFVDPMFENPDRHTSGQLLLATYAFTFQVYFDLSGYCDIAVGSARLFGIRLTENFRRPFFSRGIADFWRRWHITLVAVGRDYVVKPIRELNSSRATMFAVITVSMALMGIWHSLTWTFLLWGGLHASYLLAERALAPFGAVLDRRIGRDSVLGRVRTCTAILGVFHLVAIANLFFRATSIDNGKEVLLSVLHWESGQIIPTATIRTGRELVPTHTLLWLVIAVVGVLIMLSGEWVSEFRPRWRHALRSVFIDSRAVRWGLYYAAIIAVLALGIWNGNGFIYFQY